MPVKRGQEEEEEVQYCDTEKVNIQYRLTLTPLRVINKIFVDKLWQLAWLRVACNVFLLFGELIQSLEEFT